jgi:transcription antitermination factor NusA-like protein
MIKNGKGGANTNKTGLKAEARIKRLFNKNFFPPHFLVGQKKQIYKYNNIGLIFDKKIIDIVKYMPEPDIFIYNLKNKKL